MDSNDRKRIIETAVVVQAVLVLVCLTWWPHIRDELFVIMGNRNETGGWYGFWSAFGGATRTVEYLILAAVVYWHHTCHYARGCLRWGKYPAADGMFKLCHRHHPDLDGARPTHDLIHRLHRERS